MLLIAPRSNPQLLSYDTTFKFGDFYISPLLFRAVCFVESLVMPAMYLIHERKLTSTHQTMCTVLAVKVPELLNARVAFVTDHEKAFDVFQQKFPNLTHRHCWNHLLLDIKLWVQRHNGQSSDAAVYVADVRDLLQSRTNEIYEHSLAEKSRKWSSSFDDYYNTEVHRYVNAKFGRWVLESMRVYNPYSGITQNMSEGFNTVLKRYKTGKKSHWTCVFCRCITFKRFTSTSSIVDELVTADTLFWVTLFFISF